MEANKQSTEDCPVAKHYHKPAIEIIEMELEQPVLTGSAPDFPGEDW